MPDIPYSGSPYSKIWIIVEHPYEKDFLKNELYTSPFGWVWRKIWEDTGINEAPFYICLKPDPSLTYDDFMQRDDVVSQIHRYKPPIILPMGKRITALFCPSTILKKKGKKNVGVDEKEISSLDKYAGSLLVSPLINYDHYCIPQFTPDMVVADWSYRDICVNLDLGHVREEIEYYEKNGKLNPLPNPTLIIKPTFEVLMETLEDYHKTAEYISSDIETIRPPKNSLNFKNHPGYPYTLGLAKNRNHGISFSFWDYELYQLVPLWRLIGAILAEKKQIGQNYFTFDAHFLEALGFEVWLEGVQDTLIRHHILWPELEHKLQFLTKQYTRQPYYKDEGKTWSPKNKSALMHYNALDATTTFWVFEGQEEEFADRPHLK